MIDTQPRWVQMLWLTLIRLTLGLLYILHYRSKVVPQPVCDLCNDDPVIENFCECTYCICLDCFKRYKETWFTTQRLKTFGCPLCDRPINNDHAVYDLCTDIEKERWHTVSVDTGLKSKRSLRERLTEFRIRMTTTKCPGCRIRVKKIDGCNHISCVCGTDFCYKCGEIMNTPDDQMNFIWGNPHACRKFSVIRSRP